MSQCTKELFGIYDDGREVYAYKLMDDKGQYVTVMNIGCAFLDIMIKDRNGELVDVNLGMPSYENYHQARSIMGATIGRCANRIKDGKFTLNGVTYQLDKNERGGVGHLHGGKTGFQMRYWDGEIVGDTVEFTYVSADGEEGYPGTLTVKQTLSFRDGVLRLVCDYESDADTIANFTNHAFFNLNGQGSGDILGHKLWINADHYSATDEAAIPVAAAPVEGTPFDFRTEHAVGDQIASDFPQLAACGGYDVNYVLNEGEHAASIVGDISGIRMDIYTKSPDMQLFTGQGLGLPFLCKGKRGAIYVHQGGFCLEPHAEPNAVNSGKLEQVLVQPGKKYQYSVDYAFTVDK